MEEAKPKITVKEVEKAEEEECGGGNPGRVLRAILAEEIANEIILESVAEGEVIAANIMPEEKEIVAKIVTEEKIAEIVKLRTGCCYIYVLQAFSFFQKL